MSRAEGIAYLTGLGTTSAHPSAMSQKFDEHGAVLPFAGNTFICHIPPLSAAHAALTTASLMLQQGPLAHAFSFLPPSSFHMTVFEGVTNVNRKTGRWPRHIPTDAAVEDVTSTFKSSVASLTLPNSFRIAPTGLFAGFSLSVAGATSTDEANLRLSRSILREATNIDPPDFAAYRFHITLAYLLRWLTIAEAELVMDLSETVFKTINANCPQIELGAIEFCAFDNMHAFHPVYPRV